MLPSLRRETYASAVIKAVLFDFDGTLTKPGALDFAEIRAVLGCPAGVSILAFIGDIADEEDRLRAERSLSDWERSAANCAVPNEGAETLIEVLRRLAIPVGIQTRNTHDSVRRSLARFSGMAESDFRIIIARDSGVPPKPDPAGIRIAAAEMGVAPSAVLIVGDYRYELEAAEAAGAPSVYVRPPHRHDAVDRCLELASYVVDSIGEIHEIVKLHTPLPEGKVPNELLAQMIGAPRDESIVVGPAPGEDVAVVRPPEGRLLAVKSDPITFETDRPGFYTVTVNANDIATSGAVPRWMTATVLFPPRSTPAAIRLLLGQLRDAAEASGLVLVGGHTEITDAVRRIVVSGTVIGTVAPEEVLRKDAVEEGDVVVMTKHAGLEGTSILAADPVLRERGVAESLIGEATKLSELLSIVPEARIAGRFPGVRCLHDVTEGGVATAIEEVSLASGRSVTIDVAAIPVLESTRAICAALGLDPLGLIGSGSLLICVARDSVQGLLDVLRIDGIVAARIGTIGPSAERLPAVFAQQGPWPRFATDELARHFEG